MTKILAVDDNILNLRLIQNILKRDDRIINTCESGKEALANLEKNPDTSLIIMDIQMPGMNGFDTVRVIKQNPDLMDIPIIFVTGMYLTDEFVNLGFDLGCYDFILKPYDENLLQNKVNSFINIYTQKRESEQQTKILENLNRHFSIINLCEGIFKNDS